MGKPQTEKKTLLQGPAITQEEKAAFDLEMLQRAAIPITKLAFPRASASHPEILKKQRVTLVGKGSPEDKEMRAWNKDAVGWHSIGGGNTQESQNFVQRSYSDGTPISFADATAIASHEKGHGFITAHDDTDIGIMSSEKPEVPEGVDPHTLQVFLASKQGGRDLDAEQRDVEMQATAKNRSTILGDTWQRLQNLFGTAQPATVPSKSFDFAMMRGANYDPERREFLSDVKTTAKPMLSSKGGKQP